MGMGIDQFDERFCFDFQPIVRVDETGKQVKVIAQEALLHTVDTGKFPVEFFIECINSEEQNSQLFQNYIQMADDFFQTHRSVRLHLNVDPKQIQLAATWKDLHQLLPFSSHVTLELTERPMTDGISNACQGDAMKASISAIHKLGFKIALDDVGTGENTMKLAEAIGNEVDCLKFTLINYCVETYDSLCDALREWRSFADGLGIPLILEGIETKEQACFFAHEGFFLQQGFYWDKQIDDSLLHSAR